MKPTTANDIINAIKEIRKLLNEIKSNLLHEYRNEVRETLHKKEVVYNFLNKKEQKDGLTYKEKNMAKITGRRLKNLKKYLEKFLKSVYNVTYGLNYLFNEINKEDYYEPEEIKSTFDGGYTRYESRGDKHSKLSIDEYFDKISPYLKNMIDNHKARGELKIQLSMRIIFVSFLDANETLVMHIKSENIVVMNGTETNDAINELLKSFYKRYQEGLETKMNKSSYIFELVDLLEYHLHKISLNRGSSYINSPEWIKNKGVTINPKNTNDNRCFQYAITASLKYQNIDHHPERISKLKPFINNYNWEDIEFPSRPENYEKFERNNKTIALNIFFVPRNTKQIRQAHISEYNNKRNNQVNLLKINDGTNK